MILQRGIFNRLGVAGAVLQTPLSLNDSLSQRSFSSKFVRCCVSCVTCHVSYVTCKFFFLQIFGASRWRVCYQWGLPRIVSNYNNTARVCSMQISSRGAWHIQYLISQKGPQGKKWLLVPASFRLSFVCYLIIYLMYIW